MKKILVLGAMSMHVPLIKRAKERGLYVLTCDYIHENEGHKYADEPHYDSTTDFESVLLLAQKSQVHAVLTFNSDPAALTAAYVATQMGLPNGGYDAVKIMSEKDLFRQFLFAHGFNTPKFMVYTSWDELKADLNGFDFPVLLKPVDSSGSKGVVKISNSSTLEDSFYEALKYSRCKRVIIEEFIEPLGAQLHGDAFVANNKVQFIYLGDHHFDIEINNLVPYSTTFPSQHMESDIKRVEAEVAKFISLVGYKQGGINVEARISAKDGKVYLIEVGPRNGGNFTPLIIQYASGFNFIDAALDCALGIVSTDQTVDKKAFFAYLICHSDRGGLFKSAEISSVLKEKILIEYWYLKPGDPIIPFCGANAAIGVLLVHFNSLCDMTEIVDNFSAYYRINFIE